jgi:hypothetical protein
MPFIWETPGARVDLLCISASRQEVEAGDTSHALAILQKLLKPEVARRARQRLVFSVNGYSDDPRELHMIPKIREWMRELDHQFPYWFYFMSTGRESTLAFVTLSLCEYDKVPGGSVARPESLDRFMLQHFVAMNKLCDALGEPEDQLYELSRQITDFYLGDT